MTEKKKINVNIGGRNFTVVGDKDEKHIKELASYVNSKIEQVRNRNENLSSSILATLAALNISDDLYELEERMNKLKRDAKEPMEKYNGVVEELGIASDRYKNLEMDYSKIKNQLREYKMGNKLLLKKIDDLNKSLNKKDLEILELQNSIKSLQEKIFKSQMDLIDAKKELEETLRFSETN